MKLNITATIDLEVSASELAESYINGNRNGVIQQLENDHPGLTALLLVQHGPGCGGKLSQSDCNTITNRLLDARAEHCM